MLTPEALFCDPTLTVSITKVLTLYYDHHDNMVSDLKKIIGSIISYLIFLCNVGRLLDIIAPFITHMVTGDTIILRVSCLWSYAPCEKRTCHQMQYIRRIYDAI